MAAEEVEVEQERRRRAEEEVRVGAGWRLPGVDQNPAGLGHGVDDKQPGWRGRSERSQCLVWKRQLVERRRRRYSPPPAPPPF